MPWLTGAKEVVIGLTRIGIALLALSIVLQVLFGSGAPFVPGDVVKNVIALIAAFGDKGLIGLVALGVTIYILQRN